MLAAPPPALRAGVRFTPDVPAVGDRGDAEVPHELLVALHEREAHRRRHAVRGARAERAPAACLRGAVEREHVGRRVEVEEAKPKRAFRRLSKGM